MVKIKKRARRKRVAAAGMRMMPLSKPKMSSTPKGGWKGKRRRRRGLKKVKKRRRRRKLMAKSGGGMTEKSTVIDGPWKMSL